MNPIELTELQMKCLGCALAHPEEPAVRHLLDRTGATTVEGVLAALYVARIPERSILLGVARQVIAQHRPSCETPAQDCMT